MVFLKSVQAIEDMGDNEEPCAKERKERMKNAQRAEKKGLALMRRELNETGIPDREDTDVRCARI
jgi:hypothetical protein